MLIRESFLLRIASDPPARLWTGEGELEIPADSVEEDPATYIGASHILSAPDFDQLLNGTAQRLEFRLSGVSAETLRAALEDAPSVKGADVHLGIATFGPDWELLSVTWEAMLRADGLTVDSQGDEDGRTRTITLSVGSDDTGRSRAPVAFFTDADQRRRSADDAIFSHVGGIYSGTTRRFGPK